MFPNAGKSACNGGGGIRGGGGGTQSKTKEKSGREKGPSWFGVRKEGYRKKTGASGKIKKEDPGLARKKGLESSGAGGGLVQTESRTKQREGGPRDG